MIYKLKTFRELTTQELYQLLKLRNAIFIVEQNCPYQDIDDKDQEALHLLAEENGKLAAYLRIITGEVAAIGRVLVAADFRNRGLARTMMQKAIQYIKVNLKQTNIKLQAQVYLKDFYASFGFEPFSEEYLEDGIPHVDMIMKN